MTAKLTEITTQYHTFVDNQVLTKDQLNEFISYFEDQDRMSRVFLTGTGIICGFHLNYDSKKTGDFHFAGNRDNHRWRPSEIAGCHSRFSSEIYQRRKI
jgi:hypothetical protein